MTYDYSGKTVVVTGGARGLGFAFARELGSIIAGGPAPLIAGLLVAWQGGAPWGVCVYIVTISLVTAFAVWCGPETYRSDIHQDDVQDR